MSNHQALLISSSVIIGCGILAYPVSLLASATDRIDGRGGDIVAIAALVVGVLFAAVAITGMKQENK